MKKILTIGAAILSFAAFTSIANAATPGTYLGLGLGASRLETNDKLSFTNGTTSSSSKKGGLGERLFAGYNFNEYFGVEAGLAHYAKSSYDASTIGANKSVDYNLNAFDVVGKAYLPLGEGFNVYALGGAALVKSKTQVKANNAVVFGQTGNHDYNNSKIRPVYGIGVSYDIAQTGVTTNMELTRIVGTGNTSTNPRAIPNADMLSFNVAYNFG